MDDRERIREILDWLGIRTPERLECVVALLNDAAPNPFQKLADRGLPFSAGAGTRQIFDEIAQRLGRARIDREARDQVMLPLREIGILEKGYADTAKGRVEPSLWKPKSPNNVYVVTPEFRALLSVPEDGFNDAVAAWMAMTEQRRVRLATAEASASAAQQDERLVTIAIQHYCSGALPEYEVVFVDDEDSRTTTQWAANIPRLDLPLDLSSRWPDVILRHRSTGHFWFVDCVESDGEIDAVRQAEIAATFGEKTHQIDGYTTVYRTLKRFSQRQATTNNIALGTYVWIAQIGGSHWLKQPLGG